MAQELETQEFEYPDYMERFTDGSIRPSFGHPKYFGKCFHLARKIHGLDVETAARRIYMTPEQLTALENGTLGMLPTPWGLSKWTETLHLRVDEVEDLGLAANHPITNLPTYPQIRSIISLANQELRTQQRQLKLIDKVKLGFIIARAYFNRGNRFK